MRNQWITKNIFYLPYMRLRGGNICSLINEIRTLKNMSLNDIYKFQWSKFIALLSYAYNNISFYRERFNEADIKPDDIKCKEDLLKIPPLTKVDIRNHMPKLLNEHYRMQQKSTSGSSGYPLVFYKDNISVAFWDAAMYEGFSWHGINIGDKQSRFWGVSTHKKHQINEGLKDFYMNRIRLSAFQVDDESCLKFYKKLLEFKPVYFYGYPSAIYRFCNFLSKNNLHAPLDLKAAFVTGEMLYDFQRLKIEETLKCKAVNEYGCTENGVIAFQCPQRKMHIMATNIYLEVVNNGKHADWFEDGDFLITELNSHSIPFIRYKILDRGSLSNEKCTCGINFPLIHNISGRTNDFIITSDDRHVYAAILSYALKNYVDQFSAFQEDRDKLTIMVKKIENISFDGNNIVRELRKYLGEKIKIEILERDEIPTSKSGKQSYFTQKIMDII
jgi:phenylacetate-CoA ligase